jgi:hypothetical protein
MRRVRVYAKRYRRRANNIFTFRLELDERFSESFTFVLNILLRRHHCRGRELAHEPSGWLFNIQLAEFRVKNWI